MLNLIKMDLRRLVRMKSFWIMIALTVALSAFSVYMTDFALSLQSDATVEAGGFFVSINAMTVIPEEIPFSGWMIGDLSSLMLLLLCAIFVPMYVNGEQKNGYVKNIAGQLPNRAMLVISKMVTVAVQVAVIFATYFIVSGISGKIFWGDMLVFGSLGEFARLISIHYMLHYALAALVSALTIVWRGSGLSMCLGIMCATNTINSVYMIVDILLHKCGVSETFTIGDYAIENCIASVNRDLCGSDLTRVIVVGIAFIVVSTLVSMFVMKKRDIR